MKMSFVSRFSTGCKGRVLTRSCEHAFQGSKRVERMRCGRTVESEYEFSKSTYLAYPAAIIANAVQESEHFFWPPAVLLVRVFFAVEVALYADDVVVGANYSI